MVCRTQGVFLVLYLAFIESLIVRWQYLKIIRHSRNAIKCPGILCYLVDVVLGNLEGKLTECVCLSTGDSFSLLSEKAGLDLRQSCKLSLRAVLARFVGSGPIWSDMRIFAKPLRYRVACEWLTRLWGFLQSIWAHIEVGTGYHCNEAVKFSFATIRVLVYLCGTPFRLW